MGTSPAQPTADSDKIISSDNARIRVIAGPGAGKSFAMTRRVARLSQDGIAPDKIWLEKGLRGGGVAEHCRTNGISPYQAMERLESGTLKIPYTDDIVRCFRNIVQELSALEALLDLRAIVDRLFPDGRDETRALRELAPTIFDRIDSEDKEISVRDVSTAIGQTEAEQAQHLEEQKRLFHVGITRVKAVPKSQFRATL